MAKPKPANPFYILLVVCSVAFVLTALVYLVTDQTLVQSPAGQAGGSSRVGLAQFMDRHGGWLLLCEAGVLAVVSVAAIGLDWWRGSARAE